MKRHRALMLFLMVVLVPVIAGDLWVGQAKRQYERNRQLIDALTHGNTEWALLLVKAGADPNTHYYPPPPPSLKGLLNQLLHRSPLATDDSPTAFLLACGGGKNWLADLSEEHPIQENTELVRAMLARHPDLRPQTLYQETGLAVAVSLSHPHVAALLLEHGAKVDQPNVTGETPLIRATWLNDSPMVRVLLAHGAKVNRQGAEGETALYWAVWYERDRNLIRELLAHGANPNILNTAGVSALAMAQQQQRSDIVALLRRRK